MAFDDPGHDHQRPPTGAIEAYWADAIPADDIFGAEPTTVEFIAAGAANAVYRIETAAGRFAVRVGLAANTRDSLDAQIGLERDVLRWVDGHQISPKLLWADLDGARLGRPVLISRFIDGRHLDYRDADLVGLARLHGRLHSLSDPPREDLARPDGVHTEANPIASYLREARPWFDTYRAWNQADDWVVAQFERAFDRVGQSQAPFDDLGLIHGDATYTNFLIDADAAAGAPMRVIDWEWCRWTTPAGDAAHFLSPVTTSRHRGLRLTDAQEQRYLNAYVAARPAVDETAFRADFQRMRPAVVLHSAAWTAAWIARSWQNDTHRRGAQEFDCLETDQLARQIHPDFIDHLNQGGYW